MSSVRSEVIYGPVQPLAPPGLVLAAYPQLWGPFSSAPNQRVSVLFLVTPEVKSRVPKPRC